jgi:hypothetical protein
MIQPEIKGPVAIVTTANALGPHLMRELGRR